MLRPLLALLLTSPVAAVAAPESELTPLVQLQMWGTAFDQDEDAQADAAGYGDPEHDIGFSIPRARVGFEGHHGALDFQIDFGLGAPYDAVSAAGRTSPQFQIANAYARGSKVMGAGTGRVAFGVVRVPFSRERLMSSRELVFQERAVGASWIAPAQDLGVLLDYELDMGARVQVGAYNGGGTFFGDDNPGLLLAGRLEYAKGDTYRTYGEADGVDVGVAASVLWNDDLATDTVAFGGDALVRVSRLTLLVEAMAAVLTPGDSTVDLPEVYDPTTRLGVTAQLSWWQPVGEATDTVASRSALELAARLGTYDDNRALSDNGDVAVLHTGVTWRNPTPGIDVGAGFIHRQELGGRALPNDTVRLWGQLRWPLRGVRTTSSSVVPERPAPAGLPTEADVHPPGPR